MVCACQRRLPSVADCQEAAALTRLAADVAQMPDSYQTLVRELAGVGVGWGGYGPPLQQPLPSHECCR